MRRFKGLDSAGSLLLLGFSLLSLFSLFSSASAQSATNNATCIPLKGSQTCQNFSSASISTSLTTDFPFLEFVSTVKEFDTLFMNFIQQAYAKYIECVERGITSRKKYEDLFQCQGLNLANTTFYYARFTQTVLCAQMVQQSIQPCGLSTADSYLYRIVLALT
jgi:hypothetical protein